MALRAMTLKSALVAAVLAISAQSAAAHDEDHEIFGIDTYHGAHHVVPLTEGLSPRRYVGSAYVATGARLHGRRSYRNHVVYVPRNGFHYFNHGGSRNAFRIRYRPIRQYGTFNRSRAEFRAFRQNGSRPQTEYVNEALAPRP